MNEQRSHKDVDWDLSFPQSYQDPSSRFACPSHVQEDSTGIASATFAVIFGECWSPLEASLRNLPVLVGMSRCHSTCRIHILYFVSKMDDCGISSINVRSSNGACWFMSWV